MKPLPLFLSLCALTLMPTACSRADSPSVASATVIESTATAALKPADADGRIAVYRYEVLARYPHDKGAFTQGLFVDGDALIETTGQIGESVLRRVDLKTGEILKQVAIDPTLFGEGAVAINERLISLTWRAGKGFVHDLETFEKVGDFSYPGEGWGLTTDGKQLIMSDGTPTLRLLDPKDFRQTGTISVTLRNQPIRNINELEWVNGLIFANLWMSDWIAIIDPASGRVVGLIDMSGLRDPREVAALEAETGRRNVLNGIAYDQATDRLYVTGKNWPYLYEISMVFANWQ